MNKDSSPLRLTLIALVSMQLAACDQVEEAVATSTTTSKAEAGNIIETTAPAEAAEVFSRAAYLQLATSESMFIVWRTAEKIDPVVKFGTDLKMLGLDPAAITVRQSNADNPDDKNPLHTAPTGTFQYEAKLTDLKPDTEYFYAIYDGTKRLTPEDESYHLQTHPEIGSDRDVYFWAVGDSGTGGAAQAAVHEAMVEYNEKLDKQLDLYLHVGDMAYGSGTDSEFSGRFFSMYEPTLRNLPCWAAMGNHEGKTSSGKTGIGPFYDGYICPTEGESGGLASGNESYYSFDYGKVHFIALNSHDLDRSPTGAMAKWLKSDLEETKADWVVCFFHHPPYTMGSHNSDREFQLIEMREHIMPILESGGCDLTLTGHSHIYERSMLVDGAYATPTTAEGVIIDDGDGDPAGDGAYKKTSGLNPNNGSINIVTGHGGTGVRRGGTMPIMRRIIVENGSTLIHVKGDTLHGTMLNYKGEVRDTFAITKSDDVPVARTPIENPWQPGGKTASDEKRGGQRLPKNHVALLKRGASWSYLAGGEHPQRNWTSPDFDDSAWKKGKAGFGYGDRDDATELEDMSKNYKTVYIRRGFDVPTGVSAADVGLAISYDDGFIAYLNGKEILRVGVDSGSGKTAKGFHPHEANKQFEYFSFKGKEKLLNTGANVIAIEGHNANLESSDFSLHPSVIMNKK
ncbi:MAG: hypothetical protein ACI9UA_001129 [Pseudoalteromonas tetraodonis]|jgi:hypothetical protein